MVLDVRQISYCFLAYIGSHQIFQLIFDRFSQASLFGNVLFIIVLCFYFRKIGIKGEIFLTYVHARRIDWNYKFIVFSVIYTFFFTILFYASYTGIGSIDQNKFSENYIRNGYLEFFFAIVILGPFVEEILFRGLLARCMEDGFGVIFSFIFGSVFFAIFHIQGGYFFYSLIVAALLLLFRNLGHSIWPCVIVHSSLNFIYFYSACIANKWCN